MGDELVVVLVVVSFGEDTVVFDVPLVVVVLSPQPTIIPKPNSNANAIVFIFSTLKTRVTYVFRRNLSVVLS